MMDRQLKLILDDLRGRLESLYGDRLVSLVLFGSQARRDATPESDVDVLVVLKGPVNPYEENRRTNALITDLVLEYNVYISCLFMDVDSYAHRHTPLITAIQREGILVPSSQNLPSVFS